MSLFRFVQRIHEGRPMTVFGDGTQERDFTYVDDIARGTIAALKPVGYEIVNLGSDEPVVLNDAIALVERLAGASAKIERETMHPADVHATWADITRAREILGWQPTVSFDAGVARLVDWYRANRDWAREIDTS
jgi:nucleoside-diphosphate-sugar epimerase